MGSGRGIIVDTRSPQPTRLSRSRSHSRRGLSPRLARSALASAISSTGSPGCRAPPGPALPRVLSRSRSPPLRPERRLPRSVRRATRRGSASAPPRPRSRARGASRASSSSRPRRGGGDRDRERRRGQRPLSSGSPTSPDSADDDRARLSSSGRRGGGEDRDDARPPLPSPAPRPQRPSGDARRRGGDLRDRHGIEAGPGPTSPSSNDPSLSLSPLRILASASATRSLSAAAFSFSNSLSALATTWGMVGSRWRVGDGGWGVTVGFGRRHGQVQARRRKERYPTSLGRVELVVQDALVGSELPLLHQRASRRQPRQCDAEQSFSGEHRIGHRVDVIESIRARLVQDAAPARIKAKRFQQLVDLGGARGESGGRGMKGLGWMDGMGGTGGWYSMDGQMEGLAAGRTPPANERTCDPRF